MVQHKAVYELQQTLFFYWSFNILFGFLSSPIKYSVVGRGLGWSRDLTSFIG